MLAEQRHQFILSELGRSGALSVAELVRSLDVSRETVRRDLNALAARGLLVMTHGGALAADRREPSLSEREAANAEAKRTIGRRAAEFVPDDASVLIDSGSTPHAVALALADRHRLSIYTNDWRTAFVLARRNGNRVTLLGGELSDDETPPSSRHDPATGAIPRRFRVRRRRRHHADGECTDLLAARGRGAQPDDRGGRHRDDRRRPFEIRPRDAGADQRHRRRPLSRDRARTRQAVRRALTARGIELLVCD